MDERIEHPLDIMQDKFPQSAWSVIDEALQVIKASNRPISQFEQFTCKVPDGDANGIKKSRVKPLSQHVVDAFGYAKDGLALYMHNLALIEVLGQDLTYRLYDAVEELQQDVLVRYPLLYVSEYPKSSSDVLVGSPHSWSPMHQDLPLFCTSVILVLEGHKEFVAVPDQVAPFLPMNGPWERPHTYAGVTYPDLQSLVRANGGAVLSLRAGDIMFMPPRVFHLARNVETTVSCNFSLVSMDDVPDMLLQTLGHISSSPQDVMHFDVDFARLLEDCTAELLKQSKRAKFGSVNQLTARGKLPNVCAVFDGATSLYEWYTTLQLVPMDWVAGFWGERRDRLLQQLREALLLHTPGTAGAGAGGEGAGAKAAKGAGGAKEAPAARGGKMVAMGGGKMRAAAVVVSLGEGGAGGGEERQPAKRARV